MNIRNIRESEEHSTSFQQVTEMSSVRSTVENDSEHGVEDGLVKRDTAGAQSHTADQGFLASFSSNGGFFHSFFIILSFQSTNIYSSIHI